MMQNKYFSVYRSVSSAQALTVKSYVQYSRADVILAVGTRFSARTRCGEKLLLPNLSTKTRQSTTDVI